MATQTPPNQTVQYRNRDFTLDKVHQYVQQIGQPEQRYQAQKDVAQLLLDERMKIATTMEWWWNYTSQDLAARNTVSQVRFNEDWKEIKKVAAESKTNRERTITARAAILKNWGDKATELVAAHTSYNTLTKLRYLSNRRTYNEALPLINRAIVERFRTSFQDEELGPQASDYTKVRDKGDKLPQINQQHLNKFNLYIDDQGRLRQEKRQRRVLGTLPPDTPTTQ